LNESCIRNAIQYCLNSADKNKYTQIAFPAIGAGCLGYPVDLVAQCFKEQFSSFRRKYLEKVVIVICPNDIVAINVS